LLIFGGLALLTALLASVAIPQAIAGEFPAAAAVIIGFIALMSLLATLRNWQLWQRYRRLN
jgi:hypothetical protein